jgi:hypothetical protein
MKLTVILFCLSALFSLPACNQTAQSQAASVNQNKSQAYRSSKSGAAISMEFQFLNEAKLNQPLEIKVNFIIGHDTEFFKIQLNTRAGLTIENELTQFQFNKLAKGAQESIVIRVVPVQSGEQNIYISATVDINGVNQSRAFVIPVKTTSANQLQIQKSKTDKGMQFIQDQNVISMPATETRNK